MYLLTSKIGQHPTPSVAEGQQVFSGPKQQVLGSHPTLLSPQSGVRKSSKRIRMRMKPIYFYILICNVVDPTNTKAKRTTRGPSIDFIFTIFLSEGRNSLPMLVDF